MRRRSALLLLSAALLLMAVLLVQRAPSLASAPSSRPEFQGSTTVTPNPTLRAGAQGDFDADDPIYGPESGFLPHDPNDDFISESPTGVRVANFVVEATFINPFEAAEVIWSQGIIFRSGTEGQYRLIFDGAGGWELSVFTDDFVSLQSGVATVIDASKGGENSIRLAVDGDQGFFTLNGEQIAVLDLSEITGPGDISVATGMYTGSEIAGAQTEYEDLTIYSIGILPTLTPTATPAAAARDAVIGDNNGEIEVGGGELWRFEGTGGRTYAIRVLAEFPAGRSTTTQERLEQGLFDTYVIVRAPNGEIIAENDDDETRDEEDLLITNSRVEVTLPADGLYSIEVRSYADESGGRYTLSIAERRSLSPVTPTPTPQRSGG